MFPLIVSLVLFQGNLKHLPFIGSGETWETYEAQFEEALTWLEVRERQPGWHQAPEKTLRRCRPCHHTPSDLINFVSILVQVSETG